MELSDSGPTSCRATGELSRDPILSPGRDYPSDGKARRPAKSTKPRIH